MSSVHVPLVEKSRFLRCLGYGRLFGSVPIVVLSDRRDADREVELLRRKTMSCVLGPFGPVRLGVHIGGVVRWVLRLVCVKERTSAVRRFSGVTRKTFCTVRGDEGTDRFVSGVHRGCSVIVLFRRQVVSGSVPRVRCLEGGFPKMCVTLIARKVGGRSQPTCLGTNVGGSVPFGSAPRAFGSVARFVVQHGRRGVGSVRGGKTGLRFFGLPL